MINVIGLGYIGLPTALEFASHGAEVVGTDCDEKLIADLQLNQLTFEEMGLEQLFADAVSKGIKFSVEYQNADVYIVAVPTPYDTLSKKIDMCYVIAAIKNILKVCKQNAYIVIESTVSPGSIDKYVRPLINANKLANDVDVHLLHAPERIIPGNMLYELKNNARTIGADNLEAAQKIKNMYSTFCDGEIVLTDICTAEMSKVVENTFRDINIAYANELAKICRSDGMDVYEIIRIANKHPRVNIMQPGPGVGGHCISVDPWFLVGDYPGLANLILTARSVNDSMPEFVLERISEIMKKNGIVDTSKVGLYGLTYKENVDDTRGSPTLQLLQDMKKHLAAPLKVYDPYIKKDIVENQYHDFESFLSSVDMIVIMVGHDEIKENMHKLSQKIIFDTKNICELKNSYKL